MDIRAALEAQIKNQEQRLTRTMEGLETDPNQYGNWRYSRGKLEGLKEALRLVSLEEALGKKEARV